MAKPVPDNTFSQFPIYFSPYLKKTVSDNPVDTGRKLNVHKAFSRHPGRLLNVLFTFNLRLASTGKFLMKLDLIENESLFCSK